MTGRSACAPWATASSRSTPRRTSAARSSRRTRRGRCTRSAFATGDPAVELERWADWAGAAAAAHGRGRRTKSAGARGTSTSTPSPSTTSARNLARANDWPIDVFQLDDGFQSEIGDWLEPQGHVPGSLDALAARHRRRGLRARDSGSRRSSRRPARRVAQSHPDWIPHARERARAGRAREPGLGWCGQRPRHDQSGRARPPRAARARRSSTWAGAT